MTCDGWRRGLFLVWPVPVLPTHKEVGDFAIAFTTSPEMRTRYGDKGAQARNVLPYDAVSPLFQAALEATEEAVYNALFKATTVSGMGETREAIPIDAVREILVKYRVVK